MSFNLIVTVTASHLILSVFLVTAVGAQRGLMMLVAAIFDIAVWMNHRFRDTRPLLIVVEGREGRTTTTSRLVGYESE